MPESAHEEPVLNERVPPAAGRSPRRSREFPRVGVNRGRARRESSALLRRALPRLAGLALALAPLGCISPVVVGSGGIGLGIFALEQPDVVVAGDRDAVDASSVRGFGIHLGLQGFAIGLLRWQTIRVDPDSEGVVIRTDWLDARTGQLAERPSTEENPLP